jgi:hypothetical protein
MHAPRSLFRRALPSLLPTEGPTGQRIVQPISISPRWEGGSVEFRSPDAFVRWRVTQALDQHEQTYTVETGPTSAHSMFLEQGAQVDAEYYGMASTGLELVPLVGGSHVRPNGAILDLPAQPHIEARFYPLILSPRDLRAGYDQAVLHSGLGAYPTDPDPLTKDYIQIPAVSASIGTVIPMAYVPGHCNRMAIFAGAPVTLSVSGPTAVEDGLIPGTYTPYGVGGTATYHELAVSPWDVICLSGGPAAVRIQFWRQGT